MRRGDPSVLLWGVGFPSTHDADRRHGQALVKWQAHLAVPNGELVLLKPDGGTLIPVLPEVLGDARHSLPTASSAASFIVAAALLLLLHLQYGKHTEVPRAPSAGRRCLLEAAEALIVYPETGHAVK